jgi:hypothetical protein
MFAMFAASRKFHEIVIETQQEPGVIPGPWKEYEAGFTGDSERLRVDDEDLE